MLPRTYLFVPGDRPDRFDQAVAAGADRVIIDLEDAVAPGAKATARANVVQWFSSTSPIVPVLVRINGINTPWYTGDVDLFDTPGISGIVLPKAEDAATLAGLRETLPSERELHALIETVAALIHLREIAATSGLTRLAFGSVDFANDAGISGEDRELDYVRTRLVLESRYASLPAPIDGVTMAIDDPAKLAADVGRAKRFGFGAKLCLHPRQVSIVRCGFAPSAEERAWAERVLTAVRDQPQGAFTVDGMLVDQPVIDRARAILADEG